MQTDTGYENYQDPRLQPLDEPSGPTCSACCYYRDVWLGRQPNGLQHCVSVCVFEIFQADTFAELAKAEPVAVEPDMEACRDYKEES